MDTWRIKRYLIEEYEIEAESREEAQEKIAHEGDPHAIKILKETCVRVVQKKEQHGKP